MSFWIGRGSNLFEIGFLSQLVATCLALVSPWLHGPYPMGVRPDFLLGARGVSVSPGGSQTAHFRTRGQT